MKTNPRLVYGQPDQTVPFVYGPRLVHRRTVYETTSICAVCLRAVRSAPNRDTRSIGAAPALQAALALSLLYEL
jgi:hypothetical protein